MTSSPPSAATAPTGYKVVPLEPTPEMLDVYQPDRREDVQRWRLANTYKAMLAAAPHPVAGDGRGVMEQALQRQPAAELNQCDGCMNDDPLRGNLHTDKEGRALMVCQRERYSTQPAAAQSVTEWVEKGMELAAHYGEQRVMKYVGHALTAHVDAARAALRTHMENPPASLREQKEPTAPCLTCAANHYCPTHNPQPEQPDTFHAASAEATPVPAGAPAVTEREADRKLIWAIATTPTGGITQGLEREPVIGVEAAEKVIAMVRASLGATPAAPSAAEQPEQPEQGHLASDDARTKAQRQCKSDSQEQGREPMNDRELIEAAAKAYGLNWDAAKAKWWNGKVWLNEWNPLTDDGDALRLAVKLRMDIAHFEESVRADVTGYDDCHERNGADPYAATRKAIVRAAAEIGRALPGSGE